MKGSVFCAVTLDGYIAEENGDISFLSDFGPSSSNSDKKNPAETTETSTSSATDTSGPTEPTATADNPEPVTTTANHDDPTQATTTKTDEGSRADDDLNLTTVTTNHDGPEPATTNDDDPYSFEGFLATVDVIIMGRRTF